MNEPVWPSERIVRLIHDQQIRAHGGSWGIRDKNLLASALAHGRNVFAYQMESTIVNLATAYASRIAKIHAYVDGNKRTAWLTCYLFLRLNGYAVHLPEAEVVLMVNGLAEGSISEDAFSAWLGRGLAGNRATPLSL